jgi:putative ABC transport system ATP-binding protein
MVQERQSGFQSVTDRSLLELQDVVKHYHSAGEEVRAVDGVSLQIAPGEMLALQGPSGSGKTTLLLLIAALMKPEGGTIRYDGRELSSFSENEACDYLMRDVGFVYQRFHLMPKVSALENASIKLLLGGMGMRKAQAAAEPWLERVGLGDRLEHTPGQLSGGERQRVAIARALAGEPKLILADEPTGNLDSARSREIVELLSSIAHEDGAAVLLVTHDPEAGALADRRCALRDGKLTHEVVDGPERGPFPSRPPFSARAGVSSAGEH